MDSEIHKGQLHFGGWDSNYLIRRKGNNASIHTGPGTTIF